MAIYGPDPPSLGDRALLDQKWLGLNDFGTLSEFLVRRAFQETERLPQLVSLRAESFRFALEQEVVDAVAAMAPWLTSMQDSPGFKKFCSLNAYLPAGPLFVLIASEGSVQSRRKIIGEFLALREAGGKKFSQTRGIERSTSSESKHHVHRNISPFVNVRE